MSKELSSQEKRKLGQLKICAQSYSRKGENELKTMQRRAMKDPKKAKKLMAAFQKAAIWPSKSVIRICFVEEPKNIERTVYGEYEMSELDPLQAVVDKIEDIKEAIKKIVNERLQPIVNLKFEFVDDSQIADVRIAFNPDDGAWSLLGTQCKDEKNGHTMNLGWFDVATTIHEFCHMLGMIHEHSNPVGSAIEWNEKRVYEWAEQTQGWDRETTYVNIIQRAKISEINASTFDPESVMLYFFPGELTINGKGTKQNTKLSGLDVLYLTKMYPGGAETADAFYRRIYNENIEESIQKSEEKAKEKAKMIDMYYSNPVYFLFFIIILLVAYIYINRKKK